MSKTKFAIGCLVQWFECDIIEEYISTLQDAIKEYPGDSIIIDFCVITNEDLEKPTSKKNKEECINKISKLLSGWTWRNWDNIQMRSDLHTIADYRREFNEKYCDKVDLLIWGESDALLPRRMFTILDMLHQQVKDKTPKYLSFFGTCKMWPDKRMSWEPLEHPDFAVKPFVSGPDNTDKWEYLVYNEQR